MTVKTKPAAISHSELIVDPNEYLDYLVSRAIPGVRLGLKVLALIFLGNGIYQGIYHPQSLLTVGIAPAAMTLAALWASHTVTFRRHFFPAVVAITFFYTAFYQITFPLLSRPSSLMAKIIEDVGISLETANELLMFSSGTNAVTLYDFLISNYLIVLVAQAVAQLPPRWFLVCSIPISISTCVLLSATGIESTLILTYAGGYWVLLLAPVFILSHAQASAIRAEFIFRKLLRKEQIRSENLLANILPADTIERLKNDIYPIADSREGVGILFADIVGFTQMSASAPAENIVSMLDDLFRNFDKAAGRLGIEKIKTIGDCYMACTGVGNALNQTPKALAYLAIELIDIVRKRRELLDEPIDLRIGINAGSVVAGVIGESKFQYDLWGHAVNLASRLESSGEPGKIHISESVADLLQNSIDLKVSEPHRIDVKGIGVVNAHWLEPS